MIWNINRFKSFIGLYILEKDIQKIEKKIKNEYVFRQQQNMPMSQETI